MLRLLFSLIFFCSAAFAQDLSIGVLEQVCSKNNWNEIDRYLSRLDWEYYSSDNNDSHKIDQIVWSFEKSYNSDRALGWFEVYLYDDEPSKVNFQFFNSDSYDHIERGFSVKGYKLVNKEILSDEIVREYENSTYSLRTSQSRAGYSGNDNGSTTYNVSLIKKGSFYDPNNGPKLLTWDNGNKMLEFRMLRGKYHGVFKAYYENGNLKREGRFVQDEEEGDFREYDENGNLTKEYYKKKGEITGLAKSYDNGRLIFEQVYLRGKMHGPRTDFYYDEMNALQSKMEGNYKNDLKEGEWRLFNIDSPEDTLIIWNFSKGKRNGFCKDYGESIDTLISAYYVDDVLNGPYERQVYKVFWVKDCKGEYSNGKKSGNWTYFFFPETKWSTGEYSFGLKSGVWTTYVPFGEFKGEVQSTTEYAFGKKEGKERTYFEQYEVDNDEGSQDVYFKRVESEWSYKDDMLNGRFYVKGDDDSILTEGFFKDDVRNGEWKLVAKDVEGERAFEYLSYVDGKVHGDYKLKTPEGKLLIEGQYKNNMMHGVFHHFDKNLNFKYRTNEYKDGELLSSIFYNAVGQNLALYNYYKGETDYIEVYDIETQEVMASLQVLSRYAADLDFAFTQIFGDTIEETGYRISRDAELSIGSHENGVKEGNYFLKFKDETVISGTYKDGRKSDVWLTELGNGVSHYQEFRYGNQFKEWFKETKTQNYYSGTLEMETSEGIEKIKLKNGFRNGVTKVHDKNGILLKKVKYKMGVKL